MNTDVNVNINNNTDYDKQFETAYSLCKSDFTHIELINMLKTGSIAQKQIAALKLDYVKSNEDAEALIANLTGCDGKIREAVAHRILSILSADSLSKPYFANISADKFAQATIDINANICRMIIDSAALLIDYNEFSVKYISMIVKFSREALCELDKFIYKDKKYLINKQLFKLYWCLEALACFYPFVEEHDLEEILTKCASVSEYTIREKTAYIVNSSARFSSLKSKLINDENYYVREVFKSSKLL